MNAKHESQAIPIRGVQKAVAIAYSSSDSRVYWADRELRVMNKVYESACTETMSCFLIIFFVGIF